MPHVSQVADGIRIHRSSRGHAVIRPRDLSMSDAVAVMAGARERPAEIAPSEGAALVQARADFPVVARPWRPPTSKGAAGEQPAALPRSCAPRLGGPVMNGME